MLFNREIYPAEGFIRAKRIPWCQTDDGIDVYLYEVDGAGKGVPYEPGQTLQLVPDAITVCMPWDDADQSFHVSQVLQRVVLS